MRRSIVSLFTLMLAFGWAPCAIASEGAKTHWTLVAEPGRITSVDGDRDRFSQHQWIDRGYHGGIREFAMHAEPYSGATLHAAARAIFDEDDYGVDIRLDDEKRGYYLLEWENFRKYFDRTGGKYYRFSTLPTADAPIDDLYLNIGDLKAEGHWILQGLPDLTLGYEREYKRGTKSRLTWTSVAEGGTSRKIGPSWSEVDETADTLRLRLDDTFKGYQWYAEQKWEWFDAYSVRYEYSLSSNTTASDRKKRQQEIQPSSEMASTQLGVQRYLFNNNVFMSSGYRYAELENEEVENIFEFNEAGVLTSFSNPEQVRNARATNQYVTHTWIGHMQWSIWEALALIAKLKTEDIRRDSHSTYPKDSSPNSAGGSTPDGVIDQIDVSENDNKVRRFGEAVSLRYTGIPRTALYVEYEGEQTRNWLSEDRQSVSANERFSREVITHLWRNGATLGFQTAPWDPVRITTQIRHRRDDTNYHNLRFTEPTTSAKSVFVDGSDIVTDEFSTKVSYRVNDQFQPTFRFQRQDRDYDFWGIPDDQNVMESRQLSDTYTVDLMLKPCEPTTATLSFSYQDAYVDTPAADYTSTSQAPRFNSDVQSWLLSTTTELNEKLLMDTYLRYSRADNFNDFTTIGMPYGADFNEWEASVGFRWQWKKNVSLEPEFAVYGYNPNDMADSGRYNAYSALLRVKMEWA